jgi:hypothetical protein
MVNHGKLLSVPPTECLPYEGFYPSKPREKEFTNV